MTTTESLRTEQEGIDYRSAMLERLETLPECRMVLYGYHKCVSGNRCPYPSTGSLQSEYDPCNTDCPLLEWRPYDEEQAGDGTAEEYYLVSGAASGTIGLDDSPAQRINFKTLRKRFGHLPGVRDVSGHEGYYGVAFCVPWLLDPANKEKADLICKTLEMIDLYALRPRTLDEAAVKEYEALLRHEAWETWGRDRYKHGLETRFRVALAFAPDDNKLPTTDQAPNSEAAFADLFHLVSAGATSWFNVAGKRGPKMRIRVDKVVEGTTRREIAPFIVEPDQPTTDS